MAPERAPPRSHPQAALGGAQDRSQPSEFLLLPAVLLAQTRHPASVAAPGAGPVDAAPASQAAVHEAGDGLRLHGGVIPHHRDSQRPGGVGKLR